MPTNLLTPLADYIPEAKPPGNAGKADPWKVFQSGVKKAPLKLVALALSACGNSGGTADIKEKLDRRAPVGPWGSWWKRTEPKLHEMSSHFRIDGTGENVKYVLLSSVAGVPADWIEPKVTPADWKKWLSAKTHEQPPGRFPTRQVADALSKWPAKTIEQALFRVMATSEQLLASGEVSSQVAEGWLRSVAQASLRWREAADPDSRGYQAARIGALLARLSRIAGDRTPQDLLLRAGELDGEADSWRQGFTAGMWETFDGDGARDLYRRSSPELNRQGRTILAREVALAAFSPNYSGQHHSALDRLLDALPESERHQLVLETIAKSAGCSRDGVLAYAATSRHAAKSPDAAERLGLSLLATLLLSDGQGQLAAQASEELAAALMSSESGNSAVQSLLQDTRARIAEERARIAEALESQSQAHAAELERERQEQERLRQQVRDLDSELNAQREESRLEVRQDMLLAVGEVLQSLWRRESIEELAGNVEAGLALALQSGGAGLLEKRGETVEFNPQWHQAKDWLPESVMVKVLTPGVVVRGGAHGDRVLLKAHVRHEAG